MQITGVRAAFYQQGEDLPYAQVYRPVSPPPEGEPVIIGGNFSLKRPGFPDTAALRLSRPVAFQPGDWVRIWLAPEGDTPDYLGQVVSEAWTEGAGEVQMRSLLERVNKCAWSGKEEGEFSDFWSSVLARANLPKGIRFRLQPDINARFAADTPFELLGDTIQAITPALGGYVIGVSSSGVIETRKPSLDLTHRFVLGRSEMPQGDATNYANCVRFSFELPSGDTGWFEGKNGPEVKRQGEVWTVETLTAREVGQPEEPLKGVQAQLTQIVYAAGQTELRVNQTYMIDLGATKLGTLPPERAVVVKDTSPVGTGGWQDEAGYVWPADPFSQPTRPVDCLLYTSPSPRD